MTTPPTPKTMSPCCNAPIIVGRALSNPPIPYTDCSKCGRRLTENNVAFVGMEAKPASESKITVEAMSPEQKATPLPAIRNFRITE